MKKMEPGFYRCKDCNRSWERMEYKMRANPPRICPHCKSENQGIDQIRENEYTKDVYGFVAKALTTTQPVQQDTNLAERKAESGDGRMSTELDIVGMLYSLDIYIFTIEIEM